MMGVRASQITGVSIVYSTVCLDTYDRKHQSSASLAFFEENSPVTGESPSQRARNAKNVSIWWRHHVYAKYESFDTNVHMQKFCTFVM